MSRTPFRGMTWGLLALFVFSLPLTLSAQDWGNEDDGFVEEISDHVTLTTYFKTVPGTQTGKIYVKAKIDPNWHLYSVTQPDHGPKRSIMKLEEEYDYKLVGPWEPDSPPHIDSNSPVFDVDVESHEHQVTWSAPIEFAEGVEPTETEVIFVFNGQTCITNGSCETINQKLYANHDGDEASEIERGEVLSTERTTSAEKRPADTPEEIAAMAELYDVESKINYVKLDGSSGKGTFWAALFGAFIGGMLLNLMPCVFPVLGLKVMGFVEQAGSDPAKIKLHGVAFALGLLFSMWVLAGVILGLKFFWGEEVNWGQQMGNPYFVGGIVILLFVLGLNLAGVFEMGLFMTRVGSGSEQKGYTGSFVSGIITTLVATPCSGPFLGTAMSYTLSQSAMVAMFLFTIFGLGIAFPYLVLAFFPSLINMLPRPGAWMETFKKLMAFTLFAAAAFFIKAFGTQTGVEGLSWYLMALCVIALAAFFYGKWSPAYVKPKLRYVWGWAVPFLIAGAGIWMYIGAAQTKAPLLASSEDGWEIWVPGKVPMRLAENKPVWVDYTADW